MRGCESIVDVDVAQARHFPCERFVVFLLANVEATVLEQHDLAGLETRVPVPAVDPVANQRHLPAEELGEALRDGRERIGSAESTFARSTEVRGDHDSGALIERYADAGDRCADAGVFADVACFVERHVEVGADEHALASETAFGHALERRHRVLELNWASDVHHDRDAHSARRASGLRS